MSERSEARPCLRRGRASKTSRHYILHLPNVEWSRSSPFGYTRWRWSLASLGIRWTMYVRYEEEKNPGVGNVGGRRSS